MSNGQITECTQLIQGRDRLDMQRIGYIYQHTPIELFLAHGLIPSLITAKQGIVGGFESSLQTFSCAYSRNIFAQRAAGDLDDIVGIVFPGNTCDSLQNVGDVWKYRFPEDRVLRLTYPAGPVNKDAIEFFTYEIRQLDRQLHDLYGTDPPKEQFSEAIDLVNLWRNGMQLLYSFRLIQPDVLPYGRIAEMVTDFLRAPTYQKAVDAKKLAEKIGQDLPSPLVDSVHNCLSTKNFEDFSSDFTETNPRILVVGGMISPSTISSLFDSISTSHPHNLVLDLLSLGFKTVFTPPTQSDGSPFSELARSTLNAPSEPTQEGLKERMYFLKQIVTNFRIDGVIICEQSFCDPDQFEAPSLKHVTQDAGIRALRLPLDPELSDEQRILTRIQSFLETLEGGI
ncbi:MAG: hypothetical protein GF411_17635 [Candidatus Lokiarchaeota archaeon]|nr:hypothetical protein [Candidatus Lokiarchaeota archaeon]